MDSLDLNLLSPAFKANPYPALSLLRENSPIYHIRLNNRPTWIISRFEEAEVVLKDQRFVKSVRQVFKLLPTNCLMQCRIPQTGNGGARWS